MDNKIISLVICIMSVAVLGFENKITLQGPAVVDDVVVRMEEDQTVISAYKNYFSYNYSVQSSSDTILAIKNEKWSPNG